MKIKSKLYFNVVISFTLFFIILMLIVYFNNQIKKDFILGKMSDDIHKGISELNILTYEYLIYNEQRIEDQWYQKYNQIKSRLEKVKTNNRTSITKIYNDFDTLEANYSRLISINQKIKQNHNNNIENEIALELQNRIIARLLITSQSIISEAVQFVDTIQKNTENTLNITNNVTLFITFLFAIIITVSSLFLVRTITRPLHQLLDSINLVGEGKLEHDIIIDSNDELGNLSLSFNNMVHKLKSVTASRDELNREIKERQKSETKYKMLFDTMSQGVLQYDHEGRLLSANQAALRIFEEGSKEKIIGKIVQNTNDIGIKVCDENGIEIPRNDNPAIQSIIKKKNINDGIYQIHLQESGKKKWIKTSAYPQFDNNNKILTGVFSIFDDITFIKKSEEALKSTLQLNQMANTHTLDEIIQYGLNEAERITESNIGYFHFISDDQTHVIFKTWSDKTNKLCKLKVIDDQYPIEKTGIWLDCFRQKKPVIHNDYNKAQNKKGLPEEHVPLLRDLAVPVYEKDKVIAIIGVGNKPYEYDDFDINHVKLIAENICLIINQKRTENELVHSKNIAEQANRAKSNFLANMSHEIRTPLNAIIGFSQLLKHIIKTPKERDYLESITTSGKSLLTILNDILDLSKIEASMMHIKNNPIDITLIFDEIEKIFNNKAKQKDLELLVSVDPEIPKILILDEVRLRQILLNLVGNAIKFTKQGHVKIIARQINKDEQENSLDLMVSVEDTGIGIAENEITKIFEAFHQQSRQDTKYFGGTGLGLTISKKLIQIMNGKLEVSSTINKGSTFKIIFKGIEIGNKNTLMNKYTESNLFDKIEFKEQQVLIVDDIESNRKILREFLININLKPIEALNGKDALNIIKINKPDLIILDLRMPILDGYKTIKIIKDDPEMNRIPVIALTASIKQSPSELIDVYKFEAYLTKPVELDRLITILKGHLSYDFKEVEEIEPENIEDNFTQLKKENIKNFPDFKDYLNKKIVPDLKQFENALTTEKIKELAQVLKNLGEKYNIQSLITIGMKLITYSDNFDITNMNNSIKRIKEFILYINEL